jgi:hypothetical protein
MLDDALFAAKEFFIAMAKSLVYVLTLGLLIRWGGAIFGGFAGDNRYIIDYAINIAIALIAMIAHANVFYRYNKRNSYKRPLSVALLYKYFIVLFALYSIPAIFMQIYYAASESVHFIEYVLLITHALQHNFIISGTQIFNYPIIAYLVMVAVYALYMFISIRLADWQNVREKKAVH